MLKAAVGRFLTREEIGRGIEGAWRLALRDPGGMRLFDLSLEGFWKSFLAAILVLPGYALLVAHQFREVEPLPAVASIVLVEGFAYLGQWLAFVLVAVLLARFLHLEAHFVAYVVAANWATVIETVAVVAVLVLAELLPALSSPLFLLLSVAVLYYHWFIVRTAFGASPWAAVAVVLLQLLVDALLTMGTTRMYASPDSPLL